MADEEMVVEELPEEEVELVFEDGPEKVEDPDRDIPEDLRNLSRADLAKMLLEVKTQADPVRAMQAGIAALGDRLAPTPPPEAVEAPPGLDFGEDEAREIDEKIFAVDERPSKYLRKILNEKVKPYVDYNMGLAAAKFAEQEEHILMGSDPEYKRWKPEIDALLGTLDSRQRNSPGVRKWALDQVKVKNLDKIIEEKVAEKLKGATAQKGPTLPPKQSVSGGNPPSGSAKRTVRVDQNDPVFQAEVRRAESKGMGPTSPLWGQYVQNIILPKVKAAKGKK